ncbi:MAG: hypothetical protein ACTSVI_04545 [Promethearchaeota archaeon]
MTSNLKNELSICRMIDEKIFEKENIKFFSRKLEVSLKKINEHEKSVVGHVFTLYGDQIEKFLQIFTDPKARAINIYDLALKLQKLYEILFNRLNPDNFLFNRIIFIDKQTPIFSFIQKLREMDDDVEFIKTLKLKPDEYYSAELDCIISFSIDNKTQKDLVKKRLFFESKMFTVPLKRPEKLKILSSHLSSSNIKKYLLERGLDYQVLMTFSYLHEKDTEAIPVTKENDRYINDLPSAWCVHLVFINKLILKYFEEIKDKNRIQILSELIIDIIQENQLQLLRILQKENNLSKNINFRITYNIIKVVLMYQYLEEKDKEIERLKQLFKEAEQRREEEARRRKEAEQRREEEARRRKEAEQKIKSLLEEKHDLIQKLKKIKKEDGYSFF